MTCCVNTFSHLLLWIVTSRHHQIFTKVLTNHSVLTIFKMSLLHPSLLGPYDMSASTSREKGPKPECFKTNLKKKQIIALMRFIFFFAGLSGKSQILFALVFSTRYLDLVLTFISVYNTVMKIIYLVCAYGTVYLMLIKFKATYDSNHDTFRIEFLLIPVAGLACLVNHEFSVLEVSL